MYYTLYTSSDYFEKTLEEDDNLKICLICWLPNKNKDIVKNMKDFPYILTTCDCNALFHNNCFKEWINKSNSCPICRKSITINYLYNYNISQNIKLVLFYFFFFNYINCFLQIIQMISLINLFLFYLYIIYLIFLFGKNFEYEIYF